MCRTREKGTSTQGLAKNLSCCRPAWASLPLHFSIPVLSHIFSCFLSLLSVCLVNASNKVQFHPLHAGAQTDEEADKFSWVEVMTAGTTAKESLCSTNSHIHITVLYTNISYMVHMQLLVHLYFARHFGWNLASITYTMIKCPVLFHLREVALSADVPSLPSVTTKIHRWDRWNMRWCKYVCDHMHAQNTEVTKIIWFYL